MNCGAKYWLTLAALGISMAACSGHDADGAAFIDGASDGTSDFRCSDHTVDTDNPPSEVIFLGNSLLLGNVNFGLSASDSTKDYFARVDSAFRKLNPDYVSRKVMARNYELLGAGKEEMQVLTEVVEPGISPTADLVIVQLGDNIDSEWKDAVIKGKAERLLSVVCNVATDAKVVWVGEWYSTPKKQKALKEVAQEHNAQFIDISDLNVPENQGRVGDIVTYPDERIQPIIYKSYSVSRDTVSFVLLNDSVPYEASVVVNRYNSYADTNLVDIIGYQGIVTGAEAASHPNDRGFELIAQRMLEELGFKKKKK